MFIRTHTSLTFNSLATHKPINMYLIGHFMEILTIWNLLKSLDVNIALKPFDWVYSKQAVKLVYADYNLKSVKNTLLQLGLLHSCIYIESVNIV